MKYDCEIIQDLLPLYQDDVLSNKSIEIINEHICECNECRKLYEERQKDNYEYNKAEDTVKISTKSMKNFLKKIKAVRITAITLLAIIIISVPLLCISANTLNTVDFISGGIGVVKIICTNTDYVEIQSSPRVILTKSDNAEKTFIELVESEGYTIISNDNKNLTEYNTDYSLKSVYMPDKIEEDKDNNKKTGIFIIEKNGRKEYVSWYSTSLYSKFVW